MSAGAATKKTGTHTLRNIVAAILLLLGACLLYGWWAIRRSLPQTDGEAKVPELSHPVTVDRDRWGVPWIQAWSLDDLMTAQGYVVAQDRLWQMDLLRRAAGGELSEIFGARALAIDRENRTLGMRVAAEAAAAHMDDETRKIAEAYARGVNRYIHDRSGRLPLEFTLLRYQPRDWTPVDTFLISAYMWKTLTTTWKAKLNRARITAMAGPERARDLFVSDSPLDHFIVNAPPDTRGPRHAVPVRLVPAMNSPKGADDANSEMAWQEARDFLSLFEQQTSEIIGSNSFVVSGEHTASGKPILANDTHLGFSMPGIWYIVHLTAPGWNLAGFTFPGSPLVVIGHNEQIAWGFTNSNADVQDLYAETFDPANPLEYRATGVWLTAQTRREVIHVKDAPDENLDVVLTRHGPIVRRDAASDGGHAYALRWTMTEPGGLDFSYPLVGTAKNWNEFQAVLGKIAGPGQNAIYADVDGNIGFMIGARIPIRKTGDGALPASGENDDAEWIGYIPVQDLPRALNPTDGIIATANARTVGPGYKYHLSDRWSGPYRTERMYQLLSARKDLRPGDANAVQNDITSLPDRFLMQQLLVAAGRFPPKDARTRQLIEKTKEWDGRVTADSTAASLLEFTRHALMRHLLKPFLGDTINQYELWEPDGEYPLVWWRDKVFLENTLQNRPAAWLPKDFQDYDKLLIASADDAVSALEKATGTPDVNEWRWGRLHPLEIYHPLATSGLLRWLFSIGPLEQGGSLDTVRATGYRHGPAMRFVADLSDWDQSLMEIPAGESGQYASSHYRDQFPEWFSGRGIVAPFSARAEERARVNRLRLTP